MEKSKDRGGILLFCMTALLMYMVMPAVSLYVPAIVKVALIIVVFVLIASDSHYSSIIGIAGKLIPVYLIGFVKLFSVESGGLIASLYDFVGMYIVSCVYLYLFLENKSDYSRKQLRYVIIIYLITAITTIIGNNVFPSASRSMSTGMGGESLLYDSYRSFNIGSFGFVYELVLPVAFLPFVFKQKVIPRWVSLSIYTLILYCMYAAQFTIALVCVIGFGVFFFMGSIQKVRSLVGYAIMGLVIIILITPILLQFAATNIGDELMSQRFEEMGNVVSGSGATADSDVDARQYAYSRSINLFLENPLLGSGKGGGGHSYVLDFMAKYGLFGIIMLWIMLKSIFNIYIRPFRNTRFYGYFLLSFIVYILLLVLNPAPLYMGITFLVPLIAYVLSLLNGIKKI